ILKRYAFAGDRVIILTPCLTDEALLSVPPSEELLHQLIQEGRRIILTVARLDGSERYKGHEVVVRALPTVVSEIPNVTYLVVGDGDDRPRLEALVRDLKLTASVVFAGKVTDSELAACYRASEAFVMP